MKVRFVCDCCDYIFDEVEALGGKRQGDFQALTDSERHDIILQDWEGSEIYVSATCEECGKELGLNEKDDLIFYRAPLIH